MSTIENVEQTTNQLITNRDVTKFALGFNKFIKGDVTASGADVDITQGLVMGRIDSTGLLVACVATATDGSQIPVGLAVIDQTVADGDTETINLVNKGNIAELLINFAGAETLATLIGPADNQRNYRDYLNDLGLSLSDADELTAIDNQ